MKKFYAILLGLALVLGLATIASAYDLKVTGEFEGIGIFDGGTWTGLGYDAATMTVGLSGAMGDNATGTLKVAYDQTREEVFVDHWIDIDDDDLEEAGEYFSFTQPRLWVSEATLTYNVTDSFYIGYQWIERADGKGYRFYNAGDYAFNKHTGPPVSHYGIGSIYFQEKGSVLAGVKFDGGEVKAYTDLADSSEMSFYLYGTYAADALTIKAWLASNGYTNQTHFVGMVGYDFTDELNVQGFVGSDEGDVMVGAKATYAIEDLVTLKALVDYWTDPFYNSDYYFKATLTAFGEIFQPFAEYDKTDGVSIGWDYYLGDSDFWGEYYFDTQEFDIAIDIVF